MSATFAPSTRVGGKYLLQRLLGRGGMGEVWLARNDATGAQVALKALSAAAREADGDGRFRREARLGALLSHRHIVQVFDLLEEPGGDLVLVMEFLRGESLASYVERVGALSTREAVALVLPVLSALEHAHGAGVIHRDVTPANVFLAVDPDGHVTPKLVDFGIASTSTREGAIAGGAFKTGAGDILGTPAYMAPEIIRGSREVEPRSDLFSVAVVLYETITGANPFAASSAQATLAAVLERPVDPDPRIEPAVAAAILRALAKGPDARFARARDFGDALARALGASSPADVRIDLAAPPRVAPHDAGPRAQQVTASAITRTPTARREGRARRSAIAWLAFVTVTGLAATTAVIARGRSDGSAPAPARAPDTSALGAPAVHASGADTARLAGADTARLPGADAARLAGTATEVVGAPRAPAPRTDGPLRKRGRPSSPPKGSIARDPGF